MQKYIDLKKLLSNHDSTNVDQYIRYCHSAETAKTKDKKPKNPFFKFLDAKKLAFYFNQVASQGLVLDGKHVTIQSRGLSYDYVAYKNRMLAAYPESKIDLQCVYKDDVFSFKKENGKVIYSHTISNPFAQKDEDIIGVYFIVENKRGHFITTLTKDDLSKHRAIAKTDYIWAKWLKEMYLKTCIKKGTKYHFEDIFDEINEEDNKFIDLDKPVTDFKKKISECKDIKGLTELWGTMNEKEQSDFKLEMTEKRYEIEAAKKQTA